MITTNEWLPIGSVVKIEDIDELVMIIGAMQQDVDTGISWDYAALLYPQGLTDKDKNLLFNKDSIESIYYIGMQDLDGFRFQELLDSYEDKFYANKKEQEAKRSDNAN